MDLKEIKHCELCGDKDLKEVLNIGNHPLCDDLVPVKSNMECTLYPITILLCESCLTAHQKFQIRKEIKTVSDRQITYIHYSQIINGDCKRFRF